MISRDYIQFGNVKFPVIGGVYAFGGNRGYDYAEYAIATGKPLSGAVGAKLNEVTLSVMLRHYLGDNIAQIVNDIDELLNSGEAHDLIFVNGLYKGKYQLLSIRDRIEKTLGDGTITEYDMTLEIREYVLRTTTTLTEKKKVGKKRGTKTRKEVKEFYSSFVPGDGLSNAFSTLIF